MTQPTQINLAATLLCAWLCGCSSPAVKQSLVPEMPPPPPGTFLGVESMLGPKPLVVILPPPVIQTLTLSWDTYTDPSASNLFVMGSANFAGPYTNILVISPPNAQSNCVVTSSEPIHFYRLAVQ